jgi:hypothetical protein
MPKNKRETIQEAKNIIHKTRLDIDDLENKLNYLIGVLSSLEDKLHELEENF